MPVDRRMIEKSLPKKGFVEDEQAKHRYFHHEIDGKRTGFYTFVSRGSGYKTIDDSLFKCMKQQLGLDSSGQVRDLLQCPISGAEYVRLLKAKGRLK
jgi:hypothetical protein